MRRQILRTADVDARVWNRTWDMIAPFEFRMAIWMRICHRVRLSLFVQFQDSIVDHSHAPPN
jgi:hypothetical protein